MAWTGPGPPFVVGFRLISRSCGTYQQTGETNLLGIGHACQHVVGGRAATQPLFSSTPPCSPNGTPVLKAVRAQCHPHIAAMRPTKRPMLDRPATRCGWGVAALLRRGVRWPARAAQQGAAQQGPQPPMGTMRSCTWLRYATCSRTAPQPSLWRSRCACGAPVCSGMHVAPNTKLGEHSRLQLMIDCSLVVILIGGCRSGRLGQLKG
jgi:hypothetical protein